MHADSHFTAGWQIEFSAARHSVCQLRWNLKSLKWWNHNSVCTANELQRETNPKKWPPSRGNLRQSLSFSAGFAHQWAAAMADTRIPAAILVFILTAGWLWNDFIISLPIYWVVTGYRCRMFRLTQFIPKTNSPTNLLIYGLVGKSDHFVRSHIGPSHRVQAGSYRINPPTHTCQPSGEALTTHSLSFSP